MNYKEYTTRTAHGKLWFTLMTDNGDNVYGCGETSIVTAIERLKRMHEDGHEEAYIAIVDYYSGDYIGKIR